MNWQRKSWQRLTTGLFYRPSRCLEPLQTPMRPFHSIGLCTESFEGSGKPKQEDLGQKISQAWLPVSCLSKSEQWAARDPTRKCRSSKPEISWTNCSRASIMEMLEFIVAASVL